MMRHFLPLSLLGVCLLLSACGDGWEVVYTQDVSPYGNDRTAGSGVIYVRKHMMPAKEISIKPQMEDGKMEGMVTVLPPEEPVKIEKTFKTLMVK